MTDCQSLRLSPSRIAFVYAAVSAIWIAGSDYLLHSLRAPAALQTVKGWFFVTATALMLYYLMKRHAANVREHERVRHEAERMQALGERTARISHELRNILMGIRSMSDALQQFTRDCPQAARTSAHLKAAMVRGDILLTEILGFAGERKPSREPIALHPWLHDFVDASRYTIKTDVELGVEVVPAELIAVADPTQLHQLLTNLVINANDAIEGGGRIGIVAAASGKPPAGVVLTVRDDGIGMPVDVASRVFDPFFTTKRKGTGLGLPVVARIAKAHGGSVRVDSAVGEGTAFHVFLPDESTVAALE